jgi:hypothetical protein
VFEKAPHREKQWPEGLFKNLTEFKSITERMGNFNESHTLLTVFGPARKRVNIWDVMQKKKILLVNLKDTPTDAFVGSLTGHQFENHLSMSCPFHRDFRPKSVRNKPSPPSQAETPSQGQNLAKNHYPTPLPS